MVSLPSDFRRALRTARRQPAVTVPAVLTLALGIGINAALFSVVSAALLRPAPFPQPERLMNVQAWKQETGRRTSLTPADFLAFREAAAAFVHLGAYQPFGTVDLVGEGEPRRLQSHSFSEGLLKALRPTPAAGRLFAPSEYQPGGEAAVLLQHHLWRSLFAGDPKVVGRRLLLDGAPHTVVGVLPSTFRARGGTPDVVLPLRFGPEARQDRSSAYLGGIGRLKPDRTSDQAQQELDAAAVDLERRFPETNHGLRSSVEPLEEVFVEGTRPALLLLLGAVGFVLLLACANVANLYLAWGAGRRRETAVRRALGAGTGRLVRESLVESSVVSLAAGLPGILVAALTLRWMPDPRGIYLHDDLVLGLDGGSLLAVLVLSGFAAVAAGLAPALFTSGESAVGALRSGMQTESRGHRRLLGGFVAAQAALAVVLLVGCGALLGTLLDLQRAELGFEAEDRLTLHLVLPDTRYPHQEALDAAFGEIHSHLEALPGVQAVGGAKEIPPQGAWGFRPEIATPADGIAPSTTASGSAGWQLVRGDYFAALGTPLLGGRDFTPADRVGSPGVTVISESAARFYFARGEALGGRMRFNGDWFEVVGVVPDQGVPGLPESRQRLFYFTAAQHPVPVGIHRGLYLVLQTSGSAKGLPQAVRRAVAQVDPDLPVSNLRTLEERLSDSLLFRRGRFLTGLVSIFAALGMVLAAVGLYSVLDFHLRRRRREMGVRLALGARAAHLFALVMRQGLGLTLVGAAVGALATWLLHPLLQGLLTRLLPAFLPDGVGRELAGLGGPLAAVTVLLATAGLAACVPAWRAGRVDPNSVLRE